MPEAALNKELLPSWGLFVVPAAVLHCAVFALLFLARTPLLVSERDNGDQTAITFRLVAPPEGNMPIYMPSVNPDGMPPPGADGMPDYDEAAGGQRDMPVADADTTLDGKDLADFLAAERERLRAELAQFADPEIAEATQIELPVTPRKASGNKGGHAPGPEGAIRELDLEGYPKDIVDDVMDRYGLQIVMQEMPAGRQGQSFLSSASRGGNDRYFGGMTAEAGVYEVFRLSRQSVAEMSRLEEQAIKERGMEPMRTRVIKIVFGIVKAKSGSYDLGVKTFEAEAVE